ncbi:MAG: hypothetical protein ACMXYE_01230 [Candidatus Woesearchaeota archaeon]
MALNTSILPFTALISAVVILGLSTATYYVYNKEIQNAQVPSLEELEEMSVHDVQAQMFYTHDLQNRLSTAYGLSIMAVGSLLAAIVAYGREIRLK